MERAARSSTQPRPGVGLEHARSDEGTVSSAELAKLRDQLREAHETIDAIRTGAVDTLVIGLPGEEHLYTLASVDRTYRLLVDGMNEGAATVSADGVILYANPRLGAMVGRRSASLVGTDAVALASGTDRSILERFLATKADARARGELELGIAGAPKTPVMVSVATIDIDGARVRFLLAQDLTSRNRSRREIATLARLYRTVVDTLAEGVLVQDVDGRIVAANPAAATMLGLAIDELIGRPASDPVWASVWPGGRAIRADEHPFAVSRRAGPPASDVVMGVRHPSGDLRWLQVSTRPLQGPGGGTVSGAVVSLSDVTEARRAQEAERRGRAMLDETQALAKVGGWAYEVAADRVTWTDELYRIHELPLDYEPKGPGDDIGCYADPDRIRLEEALARAVSEGRPYDLQLPFRTATGREIWVHTVARAELEDGRVIRVHGHIQDITEQRLADEEVRVAHGRLRRLIDANLIGVFIGRPDGTVVDVNDCYLAITGSTRQEFERGMLN